MIFGKRVLVVVPARGGSKGIKLKNLVKINGKTLIEHVSNVVKRLKFVDLAVVSSDHKKILLNSINTKIFKIVKRPKKISGGRISDLIVLKHVLKIVEKNHGKFDLIVMLQPTSVLRKFYHIRNAVLHLIKNNFDSVWTISKTNLKFHPLKQLLIKKKMLNFYSKSGNKIIARQQLGRVYHRNGVAYVFKRNAIVKQNKILGNKCGYILIKEKQISIDDIRDLKIAKQELNKKK